MRLPRPLISRARPIPLQHSPRAPPRQPHQVPLLPALAQPLVRKRMPEHMRMHPLQPCLLAPNPHHVRDPPVSHRSIMPDPQRLALLRPTPLISRPHPQIPVERLRRLPPKRAIPRPPPLPQHYNHTLLKIHIAHLQIRDLRAPHPRIQQQHQNSPVPPLEERLPLARLQEPLQLLLPQHLHRLLRYSRRLHPLHRRPLDLPLLSAPPEELLQALIPVMCRCRAQHLARHPVRPRQQIRNIGLNMLARDRRHVTRHPLLRQEPPQLLHSLNISLHRPQSLVLSQQRPTKTNSKRPQPRVRTLFSQWLQRWLSIAHLFYTPYNKRR